MEENKKLKTIEKKFKEDIDQILKGVWKEKISITNGSDEIILKIHRYINLELEDSHK